MGRYLVTEIRTLKITASNQRAAVEKARMVLDHYAPDTIDLTVEELKETAKGAQ